MSRVPVAEALPARVAVLASDILARAGLAALFVADLESAGGTIVDTLDDADAVVWALPESDEHSESLAALGDLAAPVLVIATRESQARAALARGARGAILRDRLASHGSDEPGQMIVAGILAMKNGLVAVDGELAARWLGGNAANPEASRSGSFGDELTEREREVLELLSSGLSNRRIAERLGISEHTAKFHASSILAKLGARSRTEAVALAVKRGLIFL